MMDKLDFALAVVIGALVVALFGAEPNPTPCGPYTLKATYVGDDFYGDDTAEIRIDVEAGTGEIWVDGKLAARLKVSSDD